MQKTNEFKFKVQSCCYSCNRITKLKVKFEIITTVKHRIVLFALTHKLNIVAMPSNNLQSPSSASTKGYSASTTRSLSADDVDKLFTSPCGSKLSIDKETDVNKICCEELSNILEDCFLDDDEDDSGRPMEEFYKNGVLEDLVPKNKKTLKKYKNYQSDYLQYCSDTNLNPSGKVNSQFTLCNYFNDRLVSIFSIQQ